MITEAIRVSMPLAEFAAIAGVAFLAGVVVGVVMRRR